MKLWIRFNDMNAYNVGYNNLISAINTYKGSDELVVVIMDTNQRFAVPNIDASKENEFKNIFGSENVAVTGQVQPTVTQTEQTKVSQQTVQNEPDAQVEINEVKQTEEAEVKTKEAEVKTKEAEIKTEEAEVKTEENEVNKSEDNPSPAGYEIVNNKVVWKEIEGSGVDIFNTQWEEIIKNTEKETEKRLVKDMEKEAKIKAISNQLMMMGNMLKSFVNEISKSNEQFLNQLKLPWKSVKGMITYMYKKAGEFNTGNMPVCFCGMANSMEEAASMAPFSFIMEYYLNDDKEEAEKKLLEKIKKEKEDKIRKEKNSIESKIKSLENNIKEINDKNLSLAKAELDKEGLDDAAKKKALKGKKEETLNIAIITVAYEKKVKEAKNALKKHFEKEFESDKEYKKLSMTKKMEFIKEKVEAAYTPVPDFADDEKNDLINIYNKTLNEISKLKENLKKYKPDKADNKKAAKEKPKAKSAVKSKPETKSELKPSTGPSSSDNMPEIEEATQLSLFDMFGI